MCISCGNCSTYCEMGIDVRQYAMGRAASARWRTASWPGPNPQQEYPVHSLPPGFGVAFRGLSQEARSRIEHIVADCLARQSGD